jgi:hypothetical protein
MYAKGEGISKDMVAANMWFKIVTAEGDVDEGIQKRAKRCMASGYKDCD